MTEISNPGKHEIMRINGDKTYRDLHHGVKNTVKHRFSVERFI